MIMEEDKVVDQVLPVTLTDDLHGRTNASIRYFVINLNKSDFVSKKISG